MGPAGRGGRKSPSAVVERPWGCYACPAIWSSRKPVLECLVGIRHWVGVIEISEAGSLPPGAYSQGVEMLVNRIAVQWGETSGVPTLTDRGRWQWLLLNSPSVPLTLHSCHLAYRSRWPLTMGHVFICLSTKPRVDLKEVLVRCLFWGSIRVGVEGKRKPTVCVAPGYNSPACAHLGKNQWRMLPVDDLEKVSLTLSSSGEQGGRQSSRWRPAFTLLKGIHCRAYAPRFKTLSPSCQVQSSSLRSYLLISPETTKPS